MPDIDGHNADQANVPDPRIAALEAEVLALRAKLRPYRWRPIGEIHEDFGPCVLMRIDDPGRLDIGSNLEEFFNESKWTHFAEVPKLTIEEAHRLLAGTK